ncbi:hypothetical protein B0H21DRAFT_708525 [Amylocystis lapponica]|nr:hypothetical protein B0H21DRAFT_708525 [Amylocystis lapponica]
MAFRDPALDILWRDLTYAWPLLNIIKLYGSNGDEKHTAHRVKLPALLVPLTPSGWSKFLFYSSRIHTLSVTVDSFSAYTNEILDSLFTELSSRVQGKPVFPSLESLRWEQSGFTSFDESLVITFLSHSAILRCFKMNGRSDPTNTSEALGTILRKLHETVPVLEELSLKGYSDASIEENYNLLTGFQALRVLECSVVSLPTLHFCADLESLTELKVALEKRPSEECRHLCLRDVRSLRVEASLDVALHFLGAVTYPLLTSLEINDGSTKKLQELVPHLKAFSIMFAPNQALRTLRIYLSIRGSADVRLVEIVAPLLELRQLEEVAIDTGRSQDASLDDKDLSTLASSWPNLVALDISLHPGKYEPHIHALAAFARFCPKLRSLKLHSIIVPSDPGPAPAMCHSLRYLDIEYHRLPYGSEFVSRPIREAHFLHKMFPNVAGNANDESNGLNNWKEVNKVWAALRAGEDVQEPEGMNYSCREYITWPWENI